jgi:hypothetical protein
MEDVVEREGAPAGCNGAPAHGMTTSVRPRGLLRPMTSGERNMAEHLVRCRMPAGADAQPFVRLLRDKLQRPEGPQITDSQAGYLRKLVRLYRRQIPADVVALAQTE